MQTQGPGPELSVDAVAYAGLRAVVRAAAAKPSGGYRLLVSQPVADALADRLKGARDQAAQTVGRLDIVVESDRANDRFEVMLGSP